METLSILIHRFTQERIKEKADEYQTAWTKVDIDSIEN